MNERGKFIEESGAVIEGHFVYKARWSHGNLYVNKEKFPNMGAKKLVNLIREVGANALASGLDFGKAKKVGIIGPAYGAIPFSLTLAAYFEEQRPDVLFFPARTQLATDDEGREFHIIPDKLLGDYQNGIFIIHEDVVNNGTTIIEARELFKEVADAKIIAATCFADRGGQTAESLGVEQYYPFFAKKMEQCDIRRIPCPQCQAGIPITTDIGKGKEWVTMFGHPPYPKDKDFSAFWTH
jgi:orotate phosphoribosyltransferase